MLSFSKKLFSQRVLPLTAAPLCWSPARTGMSYVCRGAFPVALSYDSVSLILSTRANKMTKKKRDNYCRNVILKDTIITTICVCVSLTKFSL